MNLNPIVQFLIVNFICNRKYAEAGIFAETWGVFLPTTVYTGNDLYETIREAYNEALRESVQLLWTQRLQITLAKQQLLRIFGSQGPTFATISELLDPLDKILEKRTNFLRNKLSVELTTSGESICEFIEDPIEKSTFNTLSQTWREVKSIVEEKSGRSKAQLDPWLRWLTKVDAEMAMQHNAVERLISKVKLLTP